MKSDSIISRGISNSNRLDYIDSCKAIGIILVILGHTYNIPQTLYNIIYSFHMPLFFVLSGFVYNKEKNNNLGFKKFLIKKSKQYLIPYIMFAFINLAIECLKKVFVIQEGIDVQYVLKNLRAIIFCYSNVKNMPNCSPIWFLMCLFISSILFWFILKIKSPYSAIPVICLALISYFLSPLCKDCTSFPWKFPVFLMAVFLMYCGYYFRIIVNKQSNFLKAKNKILAICFAYFIMIICFAIVILTKNSVGMNENRYGNLIVFVFTAVPISACIIYISSNISILQNKFFLWLGRNTIFIVGFNYIFRDIATEIYYLIPIIKNYPINWISSFILTMIVSIIGTLICEKIRLLFHNVSNKLIHQT